MIKFYGYNTVNALKVLMMLLETKLEYEFVPIDIRKGEQHRPEFLRLNPAGRTPVIDDGGFVLTESNAILLYLARKTGWGLVETPTGLDEINSWLFYQSSSQGPYFGQVEYWSGLAENPNPEALALYNSIANRSIAYLDSILDDQQYLCGNSYSVADIALFPWINDHNHLCLSLENAPNVTRWMEHIKAKPATAMACDFFGCDALFQSKRKT